MENGTQKGEGVLHLYSCVLEPGAAEGGAPSSQQPHVTAAPSSCAPPLPEGWARRYGAGAEGRRTGDERRRWSSHGPSAAPVARSHVLIRGRRYKRVGRRKVVLVCF